MAVMTIDTFPRTLPLPAGELTVEQFDEVFAVGTVPEGLKIELLEGLVVMSPKAALPHQRAILKLARILDDAAPDGVEVFPEPGVYLGTRSEVIPDVVVAPIQHGRKLRDTPLLLVEVASPSTRRYDRTLKLDVYRDAGVPAYWLLAPDTPELVAYELVDGEYALAGHVRGDQAFTARLPYPVTVVPDDLVRPGR